MMRLRASTSTTQPSLHKELRRWLLLPLLLLVPLSAASIYFIALRPALDSLDRALTDTAVALADIVDTRHGAVTLPLSAQTARALSADLVDEITFAVGDPQGQLLGGAASLLAMAPRLQSGEWQFVDAALAGKPVRVAAHAVPCGATPSTCVILVAETLGKRGQAERAAWLASLLGAITLAVPMLALATVALHRGLRPLRLAADQVARRDVHQLEPLDPKHMPREVLSFVDALNQLFARLRAALDAQRAFVADAAHQLRTPLAVLRVETAQVLQSPHPAALDPALQRLHAAAERGARLAQQLLTLARSEGAALDPAEHNKPVDLSQVAADAADQWLQPSLHQQQDLGFELAPAPVRGHPLLLAELLGNLIHNANEHAGPGANITVRSGTQGEHAWLSVEDDGPGIAAPERELLWQRFRRGATAAGTGSGLGLAIVHDIAQRHGATATLSAGSGSKGLKVMIQFPLDTGSAVSPPR